MEDSPMEEEDGGYSDGGGGWRMMEDTPMEEEDGAKMQKETVVREKADRAAARAACNDDNEGTAPAACQRGKRKPKPGDKIRFQTMTHFRVTC